MQTPDYDGAFQRVIEQWRSRHRVKEDDTVMLMLELFRVHQDHWDGIRQRDTVGLLEFRKMIEKQNESMKTFQSNVDTVTHFLRQREDTRKRVAVAEGIAVTTVILLILGAGILLGKFCF